MSWRGQPQCRFRGLADATNRATTISDLARFAIEAGRHATRIRQASAARPID